MEKNAPPYWIAYFLRFIALLVGYLFCVEERTYPIVFAATSAAVRVDKRKYAGAYLSPSGAITAPRDRAKDLVAARDLWESSERVVAAASAS